MGPPVTLPSSLVGIREAIKGNSDSKEMQRTATAGFYAGFVGQGIEYTQIISKADYQLSLLIVTQKGLNAAANPLTYVEYFKNFSPQEKLEAAKRTAKGAWNGDYDSALGRKTGAAILDYLLVAIGGALMKGESAACEVAESGSKGGSATSRPTWRQSELDATTDFPGYADQKSFINGKEVSYGTKGSVRPDYYKEGFSVDIKNYNIENASGRSNLARNIEKQYYQRIENLPNGTKQSVMIDIRGQSVSDEVLSELYDEIMRRTNNGVEILFKKD